MLAAARGESPQCLLEILQQILVASIPTDRRSSASLMQGAGDLRRQPGVRVVAGRVSSVCTPPRLGATMGMRTLRANSSARPAGPLSSKLSTPRSRRTVCGRRMSRMRLESGVIHARDAVSREELRDPERLSFWKRTGARGSSVRG